jgi:AcrR family transcriptional regulator
MCLFKPSPAKAKCLVRGFIIKGVLPLQTYHTIWYDLRKRNVSSKEEEKVMALLTRRRWLEEGLALLEETGAEALTIESLTNRLGVTKGSFYHHFANYQDFKERLLEFWEEEGTLRIIQWAEQEASPPEKLARVIQASLHPSRLDVALRAWALQDERVRVHQQRIDQLRLAYLEEVAYAQTADRLSARQLARAFYSLYVGSQHLIPPIEGEDLRALYQLAQRWFELVF